MACNCFKEMRDSVEKLVKDKRGTDKISDVEYSDYDNGVFIWTNGDFSDVVIPYTMKLRLKKKDGSPEKRLTHETVNLVMGFCPFCGTKFEGKKND